MKVKQKKYENLNSLKTFYKPYKSKIIWFIITTFIANGIALIYPFLASKIILNLTSQNFYEMVLFSTYMLTGIVVYLIFSQVSDFLYSKISVALFFDMRKTVVDKMMGLKLSTIYGAGSGYFTERLHEDSRDISINKLDIYKQVIVLVVNLCFVFYISTLSWQMGLIFLAGIIVIIFLEYLRVSKLLINRKKSKTAVEKVKLAENEIIKGLKEIKGLNAKQAIIEKHSEISAKFMETKYKREIFDKSMQKAIEISKAILDFVILISAALYFIPMGKIEILGLLVVYNYRGNVYDLIAGMAKLKDYFVNGELSAKRINDVIMADKEFVDEFGEEELNEKIQQIEFKDVAFEYIENKPILKDIDFKLKSNSLFGFVGKSGSGKTTIFSLLTNFYKKKSGHILLNGMPLENFTEKSLRQHISLVLQDPYIFNDTLLNNVKFAKPTASDEEVICACKQAELHEEILLMQGGYQAMLGENGANLSGGQKQRLEIARALLKDSDVILFDEATSALDKNNLVKINSLLVKLKKNKIILVIAHRLAIMRQCDTVYVLDEGKIIAHGKHEKLIEKSQYYQNLFKKIEQPKS